MIWFYPLNELEISGYEAFAVVWLSPVLCGIPGFLTLIRNRWCLGLLRLVTVGCLASFQAPSTLSRLVILAVGAGVSSLVVAATLFSPCQRIRCQTYWSLMLGLFSFLASRVWFVSFVPTWWTSETNSVVITLGIVANLDHIFAGDDKVEALTEPKGSRAERPRWYLAGLGFGSLLFLTHWCFGEVSLITRWVVRGYPDHGPLPDLWGAPVLVSLLVGVSVSEMHPLTLSPLWTLLGTAALCILYYLPTWQGYAGGLLLAVYTLSVWPRMVNQVSACPPGRTLALANLVYIVQVLFLVWTVAYNFVPGGEYTREHTDWLIAAVMASILLGLRSGGHVGSDFTVFTKVKGFSVPTGLHRALLFLAVLGGLLGYGYRHEVRRYPGPPQKANPREFTAGIWTYHFGYDNKGWPSLERSAWLLNNTGADFITLLESDASKPFLGNNDLGMWLGQRLGMYVDFGPSTKDHTWGNLILSKYPIIKSTHHLLPSPHGELAPAITARVNISGQAVDFVVTHMGNDRDVLDRELQAKFLAQELKNSPNPAVFLGYVTSAPGSRDYNHLIQVGGVKDIDKTDRHRWCEYIMYKGLIRLGYARISHGGLSDTEVQLGHFEIPRDRDSYQDNTRLTTDPSKVDAARRFNPVFGKFHVGHGYFDHHGFHMNTPKYFLP
ncbi:PGAP2-interacting protein-like [Babylonia areolata]|uniref:PGAP2-interacting protein-like n=1 Tax=Babylonia areolata TaxID=304850 RepID=UPI003FD23B77